MDSELCCGPPPSARSERSLSHSGKCIARLIDGQAGVGELVTMKLIWLQRAGVGVLIVLVILLARESTIHSIDFPVYHRAARQVLAGNYELYPPEAYGGRPFPSQGFRYAPAVAFLFVPLGVLPLEAAALAFFVLKLAAFWYVGVTVTRHLGMSAHKRGVLIAAFLLIGGYIAEELRFGNAHFFCIALMVLAFDRAEAGQVLAPAVAMAVAIAMKITPIGLVVYFALRRRFALCLATVAVLCLLLVAPAAIIGTAGNVRQLRAFGTYAMEKIDESDNYALRGVLMRYLTEGHEDNSHIDASIAHLSSTTVNAIWILGVLGLGLAGLMSLWYDDRDAVVRLLEFSIMLTGIVLVSPHTQRRYFVALYVPAAVLVALLRRSPERRERRAIWVGLAAMAAPATILPLIFEGRRLALLYEASSPYFFGTLILFAVLILLTQSLKADHNSKQSPGDRDHVERQ
jgi:Glycosyltransferase family 87